MDLTRHRLYKSRHYGKTEGKFCLLREISIGPLALATGRRQPADLVPAQSGRRGGVTPAPWHYFWHSNVQEIVRSWRGPGRLPASAGGPGTGAKRTARRCNPRPVALLLALERTGDSAELARPWEAAGARCTTFGTRTYRR